MHNSEANLKILVLCPINCFLTTKETYEHAIPCNEDKYCLVGISIDFRSDELLDIWSRKRFLCCHADPEETFISVCTLFCTNPIK